MIALVQWCTCGDWMNSSFDVRVGFENNRNKCNFLKIEIGNVYLKLNELYQTFHVENFTEHLFSSLIPGTVLSSLSVAHVHDRVFFGRVVCEDVSQSQSITIEVPGGCKVIDEESEMADCEPYGCWVCWPIGTSSKFRIGTRRRLPFLEVM